MLYDRAIIDVVVGRDRLGEGRSDLSFTGSDYICSGTLQRRGVPQVGAAHENVQPGIEQPRLPDNFGGILYVRTQDEAIGGRYQAMVVYKLVVQCGLELARPF